ncbi:hypothetical protein [Archaeoglobus sp.]|uniref:hypothetical protein n=1 Tax=Archaeoglobus sp. TaxID=1872626 RepID=UPI0024AA7DA8|nr:hypothetical protein [Archaeoglobus sp.]MDI3498712.1 hypothetical protein [Archaeoglobus sp.]
MSQVETLAAHLEKTWGAPGNAEVSALVAAIASAAARVAATQLVRRVATQAATYLAGALTSYAVSKLLSATGVISPVENDNLSIF